ncbi:unnamed protein product [Triticum turgidum subsp. durum]|uniref:Uncharacterized protein n=1 Tax=Triticum turgidum subsp. durum TaxID=4567 RepID=A0A9R0S475_TRITD|nr:unnamed protein product [Triticum turgidum subsp. durum]
MDIQNLISFCPVLTNLILNYFEGINRLNIQPPKLEYLNVAGDFEDIDLDAPNLKAAILFHYHKSKAYQSIQIAHDKERHVKKSLGSYLSKACILTKLPVVFTRLEDIYLTICFWDQRQVFTVCSLFQNAPRDQDQASIQELTLQMQTNHLITVSVNDFRGVDHEINFVAKLLSWEPALEEERIKWKGEMDCSMVLTRLLALPRVSPRAKVIVTF